MAKMAKSEAQIGTAPVAHPKAREFLRRADPVMARLIEAHPDFRPRAWMDAIAATGRVRHTCFSGSRPAAFSRGNAHDPVAARGELLGTAALTGGTPRCGCTDPSRQAACRLGRERRYAQSPSVSSTGALTKAPVAKLAMRCWPG